MKKLILEKYTSSNVLYEIALKGSKSFTNRALILAAISRGTSKLHNYSDSNDSRILIDALTKLGVQFELESDILTVISRNLLDSEYQGEIDVGPAGTVARFLTALLSALPKVKVKLHGSERMHERPIGELVDALKVLGANIKYQGKQGCLPLLIEGTELKGGEVILDGQVSSQYFTALMLISSLLNDDLTIKVSGKQISASYIEMTAACLKEFGIELYNNNFLEYHLKSKNLPSATEYLVEGDASGASYFWGLAALTGSSIKVKNISIHSKQGDVGFVEILKQMNCTYQCTSSLNDTSISVTGSKNLAGIDVSMENMPDTAQTLAVISAFADSPSLIRGLETLRIKETDRISAVQNELKKCGIVTESTNNSLKIYPGLVYPAQIKTYEDHRMAMSFALLAARIDQVIIEEPNVVEKSFPTFWSELARVGIKSRSI